MDVVLRIPLGFSAVVNSHFNASGSERKFFTSSPRFLATITPNFPERIHS